MLVNGYEVEKAPNGAWWVRLAPQHLAWRFADRSAALRFARKLRPPPKGTHELRARHRTA
jgi:hypothetical protein